MNLKTLTKPNHNPSVNYLVKTVLLFALVFTLTLLGINSCKSKSVEIVILSTNDMHAKIDGYTKVSAYVEEQRKLHPNLLLLSAGDMFSGNPVVDQYEDRGFPIIELMNKVGYDYTTLGNHEFDYGTEVMARRMQQSAFPWISANIHVADGYNIPQPKPYVTLTVDGVKIILLGLTQVAKDSGLPSSHPDKMKGLTFTDPVEEAQNYKYLRDSCDLFIALTHIGVEEDVKLAESMPELDIIIGGHSHTRIDGGMVVNGVLVTQTECWLKYVGKTTIMVENGKVVSKKNELIDVSKLTATDAEIEQLITNFKETSGLNVTIAQNLSDIEGKEPLGCLMTDAITDIPSIDIAFQNSGGVRMSSLPKGPITKATVYELDPFGNEIIIYHMLPKEIRDLVYNAKERRDGGVDLLVSGITYTLPKQGTVNDVVLKTYDGKPLNESKRYTVGMNSYIASAYTFEGSEKGVSIHETTADRLIEYLQKVKEVDYANKKRTDVK